MVNVYSSLIGSIEEGRDIRTHRRVITGAFVVGFCCSILAIVLLFIYSEGLSKRLARPTAPPPNARPARRHPWHPPGGSFRDPS
mmetsp:Transcript_13428/g.33793  ORF Transcript_13428/g.33793 Transcript_13428/m.33793 type:complete len:84 (-) Transcript_13428:126-377(-)